MNFVNEPSVQAALIEFYDDEHVQALFKYAESECDDSFGIDRPSSPNL